MYLAAQEQTGMMKGSFFKAKTPCDAVKINRRFGGTCSMHL
jgi:hypothetical protein